MAEVTSSVESHVATIVLDHVERHNAMTLGMWRDLADALDALAARGDVRAVVLRGAGERAFVSGADISEFESQRSNASGVAAYDRAVERAQDTLAAFPCPVIAAISGICYGGGLGLALACDLRYAAAGSRFRMPAARLGLGYAAKGVARMVDILGAARAGELIYTAGVIDAAHATRIGLVHDVPDHVFEHAQTVAATIAANAPLTVRAAKLAIRSVLGGDGLSTDLRDQTDAAVKACFESADYVEGRAAFAQRRDPCFQGR